MYSSLVSVSSFLMCFINTFDLTSEIVAGSSAFWLNASWYVHLIVILPYLHSLALCSSCNEILNYLSEVAYFFAIHIHTIWK